MKLCTAKMRNAILGNDLNYSKTQPGTSLYIKSKFKIDGHLCSCLHRNAVILVASIGTNPPHINILLSLVHPTLHIAHAQYTYLQVTPS